MVSLGGREKMKVDEVVVGRVEKMESRVEFDLGGTTCF